MFLDIYDLEMSRQLQGKTWHNPYGCCLVAKLCLTLCGSIDCSMPDFPTLIYLLEFTQTQSVIPSNRLSLCRPLLLLPSIFPSIRVFSNESALHISWPKYWSFSSSPSNEHSGLLSCRIDWLDLLASPATQFESINSLVLSLLYGPTITSIHDYWKNQSFDSMNFCRQSNVSAF